MLLAFVLGAILAVCGSLAAKNLEKAIELEYWGREEALGKFRLWFLASLWVAIIIACVPLEIYGYSRDKEIKSLRERIEILENREPTQKIDTIEIKDVIYDTGRENSI